MTTTFPHSFASLAAVSENRIFEELLDAEVLMNPAKLREASRQGIPSQYRGTVYRYLLGVASMDKSSEMTFEQMQEEDFKLLESSYISTIGGAAGHHSHHSTGVGTSGAVTAAARGLSVKAGYPNTAGSGGFYDDPWDEMLQRCRTDSRIRSDLTLRKKMESTLRALCVANLEATWDVADTIFCLAYPFATVARTACDVYHLTQALISLLRSSYNPLHSPVVLQEHCSIFLMLFHHTNEVLYMHFHSEAVPHDKWLPEYIRCLLSKQLRLEDHLRLMDTYLADCSELGGFPLHLFVCLSLLSMFTEELMELDCTQILLFLNHLPSVDLELLLQRALAVRESVLSRELL